MSPAQIHTVPAAEVHALLHSRPEGLTPEEVRERLREVGPNALGGGGGFSWGRALARHALNLFSVLLVASGLVSFVADRMQPGEGMALLGWALLGVALLNAAFSFVQEYRAERAMEELRKLLPLAARVRRGGREAGVPAAEVVPGDVLLLAEGDRVPADARVVESEALLVSNAPLTGESRSQPLGSSPARGRLVESPNVAFAGTSVLRGTGAAVVFATGRRTEFGRIASLAEHIRRPPSPLERELGRMVRVLTAVAVLLGTAFFALGVALGRPLWVNVVFMLGIIVANVPEGLLPTFTLALSMAGLRMARRRALVRNLEAVEALGAMQVVCTDKTGTLTRNELRIALVADPLGGELPAEDAGHGELLRAALVASEVRERDGVLAGDPLDLAVADRFARCCGPPLEVARVTRRHFPFDLQRRREAGLLAAGDTVLFAVKGAWESIRPLVGAVRDAGGGPDLRADEALLARCDAAVRDLAGRGLRVITVAARRLEGLPGPAAAQESLERRLTLLGHLAAEDPVRDEVPGAVARCAAAGIRVVMVTGDHPDTALAVARRCGIAPPGDVPGLAVTGAELEQLREDELVERLRGGVAVFARTTPEQKTKIVAALKRLGLVVGMTGDGVNDAPALKAADVGIAMGRGGTDVARESADLVLLDDDFATIAAGVEEGRAVFDNMRTFTSYVLTSNVPEIVPFLLYVALPVPLALTVVQILSIDLGTDLLPAIGLGQEPPGPDTMRRPPRGAGERLLSVRLVLTSYLFLGAIQAAWSLGLFFLVLAAGGWRYGQELGASDPLYRSATGIALASIILMQVGNLVGRRSPTRSGLDRGLLANRLVLLGVALEIVFSWALLYWPPLGRLLGTGPVRPGVYALAWLGIPLIFLLDLARKRLAARGAGGRAAAPAA